MTAWAKEEWPVRLLMVCVNGDRTARGVAEEFANAYQTKGVDVGFIGSRTQMPNFGQLGCSGYIVHDAAGSLVSRATKGYNQLGADAAFRDVERLVFGMLERPPPAECLAIRNMQGSKRKAGQGGGEVVVLHGLQSAELNGQEGRVVGQQDDRIVVELASGRKAFKPENLRAKLVQTGVEKMDEDHEQIHAALDVLVKELSVEALTAVVEAVQAHFAEEEAWFQETGWGGFSEFTRGERTVPVASHVAAHQGILQDISQKLAAARKSGKVLKAEAADIMAAFTEHTNTYDAAYARPSCADCCAKDPIAA